MTGTIRKPRVKLKTFEVGYCVEQGFSIFVKAKSAEMAEEIVSSGSMTNATNLRAACASTTTASSQVPAR